MNTWTFAEAQARLEELVERALDHQPQWVETEWGPVVVLSEDDYVRLTGAAEFTTEESNA